MIIANIQGTNLMVLHQIIRRIHSNMLRAQKRIKYALLPLLIKLEYFLNAHNGSLCKI